MYMSGIFFVDTKLFFKEIFNDIVAIFVVIIHHDLIQSRHNVQIEFFPIHRQHFSSLGIMIFIILNNSLRQEQPQHIWDGQVEQQIVFCEFYKNQYEAFLFQSFLNFTEVGNNKFFILFIIYFHKCSVT